MEPTRLEIPKERMPELIGLSDTLRQRKIEHLKQLDEMEKILSKAEKLKKDCKKQEVKIEIAHDDLWNTIEMMLPETIGFNCRFVRDEGVLEVAEKKTDEQIEEEGMDFESFMKKMLKEKGGLPIPISPEDVIKILKRGFGE